MLTAADTDDSSHLSKELADITETDALVAFVERVEIAPGIVTVDLDPLELAARLGIEASAIATDALSFAEPFECRKRVVETKLILGSDPWRTDDTLLLNIARACVWFDQLKSGRTYADIAKSSGTSKRRVQQMIDLAFIAPDVVRAIAEGRQPVGLTSDWLLRHDLPANWNAQRAIVATL